MTPRQHAPLPILLVDDSPADLNLISLALESCEAMSSLSTAADGEAALTYLRSPEKPDHLLVLLDLNMPRMSGFDVLREMKEDPSLRKVPVVMLTTSDRACDVAESYLRGASGFLTKPHGFEQLESVASTLTSYWATASRP